MHKLTPSNFCFSNLCNFLRKGMVRMSKNVSFLTLFTPYSIYGFT